LKQKNINIITLGCSKNLVDSEVMLRQLQAAGYQVYHDSDQPAEIIVINTCGFIFDAKEESINTILDYTRLKSEGKISHLYVMGCLSERYRDELNAEIPEVDGFFGVNDMHALLSALNAPFREALLGERVITTPAHYAYLKIAEGCDHQCSFCAIPGIRGGNISKPIEQLMSEARFLASKGVKELLLIAQDLTYYGKDIYGKRQLSTLLENLITIPEIKWIRLHYAYPVGFPMDVLDVMRNQPKICNYLDIPLQHITPRILKSMKRGGGGDKIRKLVQTIRNKVPGIVLRSSFIVGYPDETATEFNELKQFVQEARFERLGVFTYSHEEKTPAWKLTDNVRPAIKARRAEELMLLQQEIVTQHNQELIGKVMPVIIDHQENNFWIGRTEFDSPEVDNEVLIPVNDIPVEPGSIVNATITGTELYDLTATIYP
jgi:ribosomal protein S12 methylthiotransferase